MSKIREFESTSESYFILDGVSYPKVYEAMIDSGYSKTKIKLVSTSRDTLPLVFSTEYTNIRVDGDSFASAQEAISRLNQVVFSKGGGSGGGGTILAGYKGEAQLNTVPEQEGAWWYNAHTAGTYTNFLSGGSPIVVTSADLDVVSGVANNEVILEVYNGVASKRVRRLKGDTGDAKLPLYSAIKSANIVAGTQFIDDENGNVIYRVKTGQTLNVGELPASFVGVKVEKTSGNIDQSGVFTYSTGPTKDVDNIANYTLAFDFDGNTTVKAGSVAATVTGTPTYVNNRNGVASSALGFSTGGLKVVSPTYIPANTKRISVSFWMKTSQTSLAIIAEQHVSSVMGLVNFWSVFINETASSGKLTINSNYGGTLNSYKTNKVVNDGIWHHVVVLIDRNQPGAMETSVYIDGVLDVGGNYAVSFDLNNDFMNRDIYFGARNLSTYPFVGDFDQFRLYPRTLKITEINALKNEN